MEAMMVYTIYICKQGDGMVVLRNLRYFESFVLRWSTAKTCWLLSSGMRKDHSYLALFILVAISILVLLGKGVVQYWMSCMLLWSWWSICICTYFLGCLYHVMFPHLLVVFNRKHQWQFLGWRSTGGPQPTLQGMLPRKNFEYARSDLRPFWTMFA